MFKWPAVMTLVAGLILAVLVGPWAYENIQESNLKMKQVEFLMNPTPPDVIVPEPEPVAAVTVSVPVPAPQVVVADPVPAPIEVVEPAHIYTPACAPEIPMQSGKRGANLRYGMAKQAGVYPCPQRSMDHTAPTPLPPGKYKLSYGSVTVLPRR